MVDCSTHTSCQQSSVIPRLPGNVPCDAQGNDGSIPDCFYCNNGDPSDSQPDDPCELANTSDRSRCNGINAAPPRFDQRLQPCFAVRLRSGQTDIFGQDTFGAQETYHYVLLEDIDLEICPCAPCNYCPAGPITNLGKWLCRMFVVGELLTGWRMFCNQVIVCPDGPGTCSQFVAREIQLQLDNLTRTGLFVHLAANGDKPSCFPFADQFCYTQVGDADLYTFVGDLNGRARVLDRLFVNMDLRYSEDNAVYPHRNPSDITLKNAVLHTYGVDRGDGVPLIDQLDNGQAGGAAHSASETHNAVGLYTWKHNETFDEFNAGLSDFVPFPPVLGGPVFYPEFAGQPIPITCRALISKTEFPAHLTFFQTAITMHLHTEINGRINTNQVRAYGDVLVTVILRVKLLPEAFDVDWPGTLKGFDPNGNHDPYDLRVADPDNPDNPDDPDAVDPYDIITAFGPNGERVPTWLTWRGLRTSRQFSRVAVDTDEVNGFTSPNPSFSEVTGFSTFGLCCMTLNAIDQTTIFGELNDGSEFHRDPVTLILDIQNKPQRYEGGLSLNVPGISSVASC